MYTTSEKEKKKKKIGEGSAELERPDCAVMLFTTSGLAGIFLPPIESAADRERGAGASSRPV